MLTLDEFTDAIRRVAPQAIEDAAMADLIGRLDEDGDGQITIEEWLNFCVAESADPEGCVVGGHGAEGDLRY